MSIRAATAIAVLLMSLSVGCEGAPQQAADPAPSASVAATPKPKPEASAPLGPPLLDPRAAKEQAPEKYRVQLATTKGDAELEITRAWAPRAADRFYNLVKIGYFNDSAFYRVNLEVAQFGINGDPKITQTWGKAMLLDEVVKHPNEKGTITFARSTSDTRSTHVFINLKDNAGDYDDQGFAPFGRVIKGMDVIAKLSNQHGERTQQGDSPKKMIAEGAPFMKKTFPKLDYVKTAKLL